MLSNRKERILFLMKEIAVRFMFQLEDHELSLSRMSEAEEEDLRNNSNEMVQPVRISRSSGNDDGA